MALQAPKPGIRSACASDEVLAEKRNRKEKLTASLSFQGFQGETLMKRACEKIAVFGAEIHTTPTFWHQWSNLPLRKRTLVQHKIALLLQQHRYPSLRTHPLHRCGGHLWSCSISKTERLVYSRSGLHLTLHAIGSHAVVDSAHRLQRR